MYKIKLSSLIILIIIASVWLTWLLFLSPNQAFSYVINHWEITLTMVFGSMIAGGTSLGGGAVAFPVFTKVLHINPHDAKLFSLAIQTVGMSAATLTICLTKIKVEWKIIFWASLGGVLGIFISLSWLAPIMPPDLIKICLTIMLTSFAITLMVLNRNARDCHNVVPIWRKQEQLITFLAGFGGGVISGLVGNGIDIITFSVMVLLFRINEKIATPTSVMLMALNAIVGFSLSVFVLNDFAEPVSNYWLAAIPVVVIGAPLGAILSNILSRQTVANILITLIAVELLTSLWLIPLRPIIIYSSIVTLIVFSYIHYLMYRNNFYEPVLVKKLISSRLVVTKTD